MLEKMITDAYVKSRLSEWGEWFSKGIYIDIGFPSKNILARMRDEGGQLIKATGQKPLPTNTKAEEMEACLMLLNNDQPIPAHVVMITYLYPEAPLLVAEKKFGYRKSNYYKQFNIAFAWIKGYLIAKMKLKKNFEKNAVKAI
jgi:hypothetical protein